MVEVFVQYSEYDQEFSQYALIEASQRTIFVECDSPEEILDSIEAEALNTCNWVECSFTDEDIPFTFTYGTRKRWRLNSQKRPARRSEVIKAIANTQEKPQ